MANTTIVPTIRILYKVREINIVERGIDAGKKASIPQRNEHVDEEVRVMIGHHTKSNEIYQKDQNENCADLRKKNMRQVR